MRLMPDYSKLLLLAAIGASALLATLNSCEHKSRVAQARRPVAIIVIIAADMLPFQRSYREAFPVNYEI